MPRGAKQGTVTASWPGRRHTLRAPMAQTSRIRCHPHRWPTGLCPSATDRSTRLMLWVRIYAMGRARCSMSIVTVPRFPTIISYARLSKRKEFGRSSFRTRFWRFWWVSASPLSAARSSRTRGRLQSTLTLGLPAPAGVSRRLARWFRTRRSKAVGAPALFHGFTWPSFRLTASSPRRLMCFPTSRRVPTVCRPISFLSPAPAAPFARFPGRPRPPARW